MTESGGGGAAATSSGIRVVERGAHTPVARVSLSGVGAFLVSRQLVDEQWRDALVRLQKQTASALDALRNAIDDARIGVHSSADKRNNDEDAAALDALHTLLNTPPSSRALLVQQTFRLLQQASKTFGSARQYILFGEFRYH